MSETKLDFDTINSLTDVEGPPTGQRFDSLRLQHVLRQSRILILALLFISLTAGYLFLRYTPNVYESSARLKINFKSESSILGIQSSSNSPAQKISTLQGEIEIIRSSLIFQEVIRKMDMGVSYYVEGQILSEEKYRIVPFKVIYDQKQPNLLYDTKIYLTMNGGNKFQVNLEDQTTVNSTFGKWIDLNGFKFKVVRTKYFDQNAVGKNFYFQINSPGYLQNYISSNLSVQIENTEASTVKITFKDKNRYKARDVVATVVNVYLNKTLEKKQESHRKTLEYINKQIGKTKSKLDEADELLRNFIQNSSTFDAKSEFPRLREQKSKLEEQLREYQNSMNLLEKLYQSVENEDSLSTFISNVRNYNNPKVLNLVTELDKLYSEFESLKLTSKPNTFAYQKKEVELLHLRNNVLQFIVNERNILLDKVIRLKEQISRVESETFGIPSRDSEQHKLERDYNLYEKFYVLFYTKRIEYEIMKAGTVQEFDTLTAPSVPKAAIYPIRFQVYGIALAAWLFLSIGWIVFRYLAQNTIINQEDLERNLAAPLLGSVPKYSTSKMDFSQIVVGVNPKSVISEAFRSLRTNLDFVLPKKDTKYISVTSTIGGEGKTFLTLNLGGVMAMSGLKVIILDFDMRKPKIHLGFGGENTDGISNILIEKSDYKSCIRKSSIDGLDYITAGPNPPNPAELMMRPSFDKLMKDLSNDYDIVFLDTPPVGLVTDGVVLLKKVDATIYTVRSNYTRKGVEKSINKLINFHKVENLSVILNSVPQYASKHYGYGGYGYGYGYGYYHEEESRPRKIISKILGRKK